MMVCKNSLLASFGRVFFESLLQDAGIEIMSIYIYYNTYVYKFILMCIQTCSILSR